MINLIPEPQVYDWPQTIIILLFLGGTVYCIGGIFARPNLRWNYIAQIVFGVLYMGVLSWGGFWD